MHIAKLGNEFRDQLSTELEKLDEKKSRGCANIKTVLKQLSQAETNCENVEAEIKRIAKRLVSTELSNIEWNHLVSPSQADGQHCEPDMLFLTFI